ncbi:MAG TPA: hypothetical protein VN625_11035 [Desulfuromonadaceae bacterium]|nr:hypothetical protein [Desulfuromonadaceae bacterium]
MPIHINLLAEMQAAEEMRRRDPVKRFLFVSISTVAIALMVGAWIIGKNRLALNRVTTVQTVYDAKTNAFQRARTQLQKVADAKLKVEALNRFQTFRFLQGNLMNALQQSTVDGVQLTRMRLEQNYETVGGGGKTPGKTTEHLVLHLWAKDFSANPGDQINKFKDVLARNPYFQDVLIKTNAITLPSPPSAPQTEAGRPYVTFALECRFADRTP